MTLRTTFHTRATRALAGIATAGMIAIGASGCTPEQLRVATLVNNSRAANGVPPAAVDAALNQKAQRWANELAKTCTLRHSNLAEGAPAGWRSLAENVGYGASIEQIHEAYMNSPTHRPNILNRTFNRQGGGFAPCANRPGVYITVQEFALV